MRLKNCLALALLLFALASLASWNRNVKATAPPPKPRWEYQNRVVTGKITDATNAEMNLFGVNGWELVAVYNDGGRTVLIFKRPL
jgi:hypothetical protein